MADGHSDRQINKPNSSISRKGISVINGKTLKTAEWFDRIEDCAIETDSKEILLENCARDYSTTTSAIINAAEIIISIRRVTITDDHNFYVISQGATRISRCPFLS